VANVFDHAIEPPESGERPVTLDEKYLATVSCSERLHLWERSALTEAQLARIAIKLRPGQYPNELSAMK
jgi:hypothetical protein